MNPGTLVNTHPFGRGLAVEKHRLANGLQLCLLFAVGYHWARYVGANPLRTGLIIAGLCMALVAISIALGG